MGRENSGKFTLMVADLKGEHIGVDAFSSIQCALAGHGTVP